MTTDRKVVARCAIYNQRPALCQNYPVVGSYIPPECTFTFIGAERRGTCNCNVGACCAIPRIDGEPLNPSLPEEAGGLPCKHLVWQEAVVEEPEKVAQEKFASAPDPHTEQFIYDLVEGPHDS